MLERLGRFSPVQHRVALLLLCVVLYGIWFVRVPLTEIDETRYTEATREMLAMHHTAVPQAKIRWIGAMSTHMAAMMPGIQAQALERGMVRSYYQIIPYFNFHPRYQKPILYYWIQGASVRVFGVNERAARLPSAVLATLLVFVLYGFLLRWLPGRFSAADAQARARGAAFMGAVALATLPMIAIWARAATTDITLTFFITLAVLAMLQADLVRVTEQEDPTHLRRVRGWYVLSGLAIGLAFLTKGPIGLVLPGMTWLIYHLRQRNALAEARRVPWVAALGLFVLVAGPWYVATYLVDGSGFLTHFFVNENLGRYTNTMEGHGAGSRLTGLLLYLPMAIIALFPTSAFLVHELLNPFAGNADLSPDAVLVRIRRFAWTWLWAVIGVFSLSKTQLPSYIQSIAAAAAILFTLHMLGRLGQARPATEPTTAARWGRGVESALLMFFLVVFCGGPIYVLSQGKLPGPFGGWPFPQLLANLVMAVLAVVGISTLVGILHALIRRNAQAYCGWAVAGWTALLAVLMLGVAPLAVRSSYHYSVAVGRYLASLPAREPMLSYCKNTSEDLIYYSQREVYGVGDKLVFESDQAFFDCLTSSLAGHHSAVVIVSEDRRPLLAGYPTAVLRQFGAISVLRVTAPPSSVVPSVE